MKILSLDGRVSRDTLRRNRQAPQEALESAGEEGADMLDHIPHPHLHRRKKIMEQHEAGKKPTSFNNWLAVKITNVVGTMWCAYIFAILALISLPQAIQSGTSALIGWIAQTFLQLVLLSIIMVGQKVAAEKSDRQLEQTYYDAEALLQISDDMHKLVKQNVTLTQQVSELLGQNTQLTEQINTLICHEEKK